MYDNEHKKFIISEDVVFDEIVFPYDTDKLDLESTRTILEVSRPVMEVCEDEDGAVLVPVSSLRKREQEELSVSPTW